MDPNQKSDNISSFFGGIQNGVSQQPSSPPFGENPIPVPPLPPSPEPPMNTPPPSSGISISSLLRLAIGILVVAVLIFAFFVFVLPYLQNKNSPHVTLTYWGLFEDSSIMQPVIAEFEKQHPNITIDYTQESLGQYRQRLTTRISDGTGPDIFRFHNTWLPMLSNVLLPLPSSVITKPEFDSWFYPVVQKDLVKNGAIYGIPLEIDTLGLYINTQEFQAAGLTPPTDWNAFLNDATTLTVKDSTGKIETAGAAMGTFNNITHAPDILSLLFLQNGVNLSTMQPSQRASEALGFYTNFALGNNNVWDSTLDNSTLAFAKGNLAMYFGYSWDYFTIKADNPNLQFKVVPVPQLPGESINMASYWAEGISTKSKHQKEDMEFLQFLSSQQAEEIAYQEETKTRFFGEPYARVDLAPLLQGNSLVFPFIQQASTSASSFFVDSTNDNGLNAEMDNYLGNAVNSVLNNTSADTAIGTLSQGVAQVLSQYGQ